MSDFEYCKSCKNIEDCEKGHLCITMDRRKKIPGFDIVCDNFEEATYLMQQYERSSNIWRCSNCKLEFYWNEDGDDMKTSGINYCPSCGKKIKDYIFIEEDEEE